MSGVRSLYRGPVAKGSATGSSAPIYVNDGNNKIQYVSGGAGSITEIGVQSNEQSSLAAAKTVAQSTDGLYATYVLNQAVGGLTVTLPAATGSGAQYQFYVGTALGSGNYIVKVANAQDYMRGVAWTTQDLGDTSLSFDTSDSGVVATESDTITLNGSTTGGVVGTGIVVRDIVANVWFVELQSKATGTEVTPFSATV